MIRVIFSSSSLSHAPIGGNLQGENAFALPRQKSSCTSAAQRFLERPSFNVQQGVDTDVTFNGKNSAYLRSKGPEAEGFGTLMQTFRASAYLNKRLRYSAYVKSEEVENWASLWMRVDGEKTISLNFDDMQNRPIKGTTDWQPYEIVLDVPRESTNIAFGILLVGSGQIWLSDIQFTEVTSDTSTTDITKSYPEQPENLDFAG